MKQHALGQSDIHVSEICLGTMTWGSQNTEQEGHDQIDMALTHGVNFIDTAEMYPTTPISADTCGRTEEIVGTWLKKSGKRSEVVLATKVVGTGFAAIRQGGDITKDIIDEAVEGSLKRLQTDYIDLYQLHWPNRGSYHFRNNWGFQPELQAASTRDDMLATLEALEPHIASGRIRSIGLSNESAWGTMTFLQLAKEHDLSKVVSIQNEYNLMCRLYDLDMAEVTQHEHVSLLAYSPLAAGLLTGKYYNGAVPPGSRGAIDANRALHGRISDYSQPVADQYVDLAKQYQLDPSQMALAFCMEKPFVHSTIIGATTLDQLKTCLSATDVTLSDELRRDIFKIYRGNAMPM
ncbi:MAG: aldo/keto reductase [Pseudomonadota bacterium]